MDLRGIIWDLDGTLADTLQDIAGAANAALQSAGLPPRAVEEFRGLVGSGVHILLERASGESDPALLERMIRVFGDHYERHGLDHTRLYPGVAEALTGLSDGSVPMSVLSNKPHEYTLMVAGELLGPWGFVQILGLQEGMPRKPDPTVALDLVRRMGLFPGVVAFIGDSEIDMQTARNAGMYPIGATWGFRTDDDLVRAGAESLVFHPEQVVQLFAAERTGLARRRSRSQAHEEG